jgi:HD-GYP domain-containing protein (c-di-GMP phosphodiesterase class II)
MVEQHHERLDGSGYPSGLRSEEILLGARIIAVADTLDAMTAHRPYRPAKDIDVALREIDEHRGRLFEPTAVDACLSLVQEHRLDVEW